MRQRVKRCRKLSVNFLSDFSSFCHFHFFFLIYFFQTKMKQNKQKAIISELMRSMQPTIRSYINKSSLILDILCMLLTIIVPSLRPINLYLFTEEEKQCLEVVVNAMIDYNLNYIQERTVDGNYIYKLGNLPIVVNKFLSWLGTTNRLAVSNCLFWALVLLGAM